MNTDHSPRKGAGYTMPENSEYMAEQHQEILLGEEEGLDVSLYSSPEFNWLQMEQIRTGIKDKVDVSVYADPTYSYETMKQIRLSLYSSINLLPYVERGFADDELEQIRLALEDKLSIDTWLTDDMYVQQIYEIRIGLYEGLNVSVYADDQYNWMQMREIRLGLEKKLKVSCYTNCLFSHWQMKEIRLGLEAGLDVSSYAKLIFSGSDMKEKRENLLKEKTTTYMTADKLGIDISSMTKKDFSIFVEDNGNRVYAFIRFVAGNIVTEDDIYKALKKRGIVNGIKRGAITEMIRKRRMNEKILIAEGTPAEDGKNGWFEFFVRLDLPRIPAPLPDGGVDYVNIEAFEMVDEGEKIAVYHPAEKGKDGENVFGEVIHANEGAEKKPLKGKGFTIAPDGVTYLSNMNGKFEYVNGQIIISNMIIVREDVTAVTGKLEVDGSVYVIGSVYSGGYISATGDIIVEHNVEACKLVAGGNVMIKKGSCSKNDCFIEAGGEVSGSFFEAANIDAGSNIRANYIMNSNINTMEKVFVSGSKGMLLGGRTRAVKGVDTYNLGNKSHIKTVLEVGKNALYNRQQAMFERKREQILDELMMLEDRWNSILQTLPPDKEDAEELIKKLNAAIVAKDHELADLDAEVSKLANMTDQDMKAVIVRGNAYEGSIVEISTIRYILPSHVSRIVFKLRNKNVVMVKL
ncbi:MAG: DUF342 domain-containing protein [Lachnospiraceae bacterium]|jgi:uncharacterized protein (DUF342 family)|nr:DUF342 domain-containing protein [Lachnospiraceae bacterium]